jgi:large subunit ribosomal protein L30
MAKKKSGNKRIRVTLVRSTIGEKPVHRRTVAALGLRRMHHSKEHEWTPSIQGMVRSVSHLVRHEEIG